jgi:DNA-binding transcriptional LysR family regulator
MEIAMYGPASLQGIIAFVQVAEAKSFSRAAERLGLSKSAVGKAIARLESRLGVKLVHRTTRSLNLTAEGETFHESCLSALAALDAGQALLASRRQVPAGRLRVDLPLSFGRRCIAPILLEIGARFPELSLDISFNDRRIDLIEEGVDLVVRLGELEDSAVLIARRLCLQRSAICATPAYLAAHGRPASLDDIARHACLRYGRDGRFSRWLLREADGRLRSLAAQGRFVLGHGEAILDAALAGHGLAYLPTWLMAEPLARGELELVLPETALETPAIHALWPRARDLAPKVRVVVDELVRRLSPTPPWDRICFKAGASDLGYLEK